MNEAPLTFADVMRQTLLRELPQVITYFLRGIIALILVGMCFFVIYWIDKLWLKGVDIGESLKGRPVLYVLFVAYLFWLVIHR